MFAGLFVVVAAAEKVLLTPEVVSTVQNFHFSNPYVLTVDTAVLSNVISNVPAVLALKAFAVHPGNFNIERTTRAASWTFA
jgi:Na+/H+ antiporter NhaD/arsenite permease-like protein